MDMKVFTDSLLREDAVLVTVEQTQGSTPRETGAWMLVFAQDAVGTVGGGQLEFDAMDRARAMLRAGPAGDAHRYALGPSLGQCCGGVVHLRFERVSRADATELERRLAPPRAPLALFGGGHVGRALVNVLGSLPFDVLWVDSRDEVFPLQLPDSVHCEHSDPVQAAVAQLAPQSRVIVMSFSHAEDLDIIAACLKRQRERGDLPYIGLIGSKSKWAAFRHRLEARGFSAEERDGVTCPIGLPGIAGKQPEVIAVSVAAQVLQDAPPITSS